MKIINIPIEPLEMRYTIQWNGWFKKAFNEEFSDVVTLDDIPSSGEIKSGSFLDVLDTNRYKTLQLLKIIEILNEYDDKEPLVLFFQDIWFPGLTNIAYIREGLGLKNLKICGCLHSGGYDATDFPRVCGMTPWTDHVEKGWFTHIIDELYVATEFHANVVRKYFNLTDKVLVTGFPIYRVATMRVKEERGNTIVFAHRITEAKHPEIFDDFASRYRQWNWVKTMEWNFTKEQYHSILRGSRIAVSFADHENWGIAMQEAALCGVVPLVPDRLSYSEMYLDDFKYSNIREFEDLLVRYMLDFPIDKVRKQREMIERRGMQAIPNIITAIRELCK